MVKLVKHSQFQSIRIKEVEDWGKKEIKKQGIKRIRLPMNLKMR